MQALYLVECETVNSHGTIVVVASSEFATIDEARAYASELRADMTEESRDAYTIRAWQKLDL